MKDTELYRHLLGIEPPWTVDRVDLDVSGQRIDVKLAHKRGRRWPCPECGEACGLHDHAEERTWRHLDSCQFLTFIHAAIPRVDCRDHGVRQVRVPWAEPNSRFTLLFETLAIRLLLEASNSAVARLLGISWDEAQGIKARAVERGLAAREELDPVALGVDEKSVGRGLGFFTLVYDHRRGCVAHIDDGRSKEALESFFLKLDPRQLARIEALSMDMAKPYIAAAYEALPEPESTIVFDRFHVMKAMNHAVDEVRRAENKALREQGDRRLVGAMHVLRYAEANLPARYAAQLDALRASNLKAARAWAIKEELRELWSRESLDDALTLWKRWDAWAMRSRLEPVKRVARMVKRHLGGILNYYVHRVTNALAESTNGTIEWIKRTARGYRNRENFKTAILFHCGGLKLHQLAPASG